MQVIIRWLFIILVDISFLISIWYLIHPLSTERFFNRFPIWMSYTIGFLAFFGWGLILYEGLTILLQFIPASSVTFNKEDQEYESTRKVISGLLGTFISILLAYVFLKYGKYRIREHKEIERHGKDD